MKQGAIVLCGGQSERMGADKASLPFGPERLLQRVVRSVAEAVPERQICVVCASDQDVPALPERVTIAHDRRAGRGPLEGLACGLDALPTDIEAAYLTGCDTPFVMLAWIERLFASLARHDLAVPTEGEFYHPLAAVYRRSLLPQIEAALATNQFAMHRFIDSQNAMKIPVEQLRDVDPKLLSLRNLNTKENYQAALRIAGFSGSEVGE